MIKLVIFDFDGVFTDGKIQFNSNGNVVKSYNAKDGNGIFRLHNTGFEVGVISGWKNNESQQAILKHLIVHYTKDVGLRELNRIIDSIFRFIVFQNIHKMLVCGTTMQMHDM